MAKRPRATERSSNDRHVSPFSGRARHRATGERPAQGRSDGMAQQGLSRARGMSTPLGLLEGGERNGRG